MSIQCTEWGKLQGLLDRAAQHAETGAVPRVKSVTYKDWASMSKAERQPLFRDGSHVHIVAGDRDGERPIYGLREIEDLKRLGLVDFKELKVVNGASLSGLRDSF